MATHNLPQNQAGAVQLLQELIDFPDRVIVIIFGDNESAAATMEFAEEIAGEPDFEFVDFVLAKNATQVLPVLETLEDPTGNFSNITEFLAVSVSPGSNKIAFYLSAPRFNHARGWLKRAVLEGFANE